MKNAKKLTIILLIIVIICINAVSFAIEDPGNYIPGQMDDPDQEAIGKIIGIILVNVRAVGIFISVVILTIIGLKYIICSVEEKANYKENMIPYVVGCFLLASATTIPSLIYDIVMD